ncbi:branched-chain amino acid aminotransferase [Cytobacillus sp. S13-E01]|uniref:branched-chain amino acid aminotransferase n=1 Tax=Cytobacillus sp. S13-E01 TaxID=3031326 RepID=UPI0023D8C527|nr:branched-chain amino acid aminotransferase [Cytobacillus sp. S13-E01]MDF0725546.1 branched-chain amino acid aminotransferase [Cytobacillus sp. S13-E01]
MLKAKIKEKISAGTIELFKEEKEFAEKHQLITEKSNVVEKSSNSRFTDAYIGRYDKETEDVIAEESSTFLRQPIEYLKKHKNEFLYLESDWLDLIGVDAVSLELDDVFGTYGVLLGLKQKKKVEKSLKENLTNVFQGDSLNYSLMFDGDEGLWNLNFALNFIVGFKEDISIEEAYNLIYGMLFKLVETIEEAE